MKEPKQSLQVTMTAALTEAHEWKGRYFAALDGIHTMQRGQWRLKRKLASKDAYVQAAEEFFKDLEKMESSPFPKEKLAAFREARQELGFVKRTKEEWEKLQKEKGWQRRVPRRTDGGVTPIVPEGSPALPKK
jgi:hypothetical protein